VAFDRLAVERVKGARHAQHVTHGSPRLGSVAAVLGVHAQIAHQPLEALLVAIVLFPTGKVSDVALTAQQTSPTFRGLHHGVIYAHRKQNDLLTGALLLERACDLAFDPVTGDGTLRQYEKNLLPEANGFIDGIDDLRTRSAYREARTNSALLCSAGPCVGARQKLGLCWSS